MFTNKLYFYFFKAIGGVQGVKNLTFSAKTYFVENLSGLLNLFTELKNIALARFCVHFSAARFVRKCDFPYILYIDKIDPKIGHKMVKN